MNLSKTSCNDIKKRIFSLKSVRADGLVLKVNHILSDQNQPLRFIHTTFNKTGTILAVGDHVGNVFFIDTVQSKFWRLQDCYLTTILKFSPYGYCIHILVGTTNGSIILTNIESGEIEGVLIGHSLAVKIITFAQDRICLSTSEREAIVWDLANNSKLQVLSVKPDVNLKLAAFIPVSNDILACFDDDTITVWKYRTYEEIKQILPRSRNQQIIKSIAFTRNGQAMVFGGHSSQLTVFMLDAWTIINLITLPDSILSIRKIEFLPHLFDGGSNRILILLSGNGIIYFFDMEQMLIISRISTEEEITKFECSPDGKYVSCILRSGEINIYKISRHVPSCSSMDVVKEDKGSKLILPYNNKILSAVRKQIKEVLDIDKLHAILKEYGEYPDSYRLTIWTQLLELPNNHHHYNQYINHLAQSSFDCILKEYPLENKAALKNLRKLLHNLVTWAPFFSQVPYLPVFVFPFVKVFQNEPVLCFEAMCTIIINWCQYWFEYFPLPPLNTLGMIENVILEHNSDLIRHFTRYGITTKEYAWPLLETAFSEVLMPKQWCVLWDHILTNEPAFFLMAVAAYNILNQEILLRMKKPSDIGEFYRIQNMINIKKLINKTYSLLNGTSDYNHPRRYLNPFEKLQSGSYLSFQGFPKVLFNLEYNEIDSLQKEQDDIRKQEDVIKKESEVIQKFVEIDIVQQVEEARLEKLKQVCQHKIKEERQHVADSHKRLLNLRKEFQKKEMDALSKSKDKIAERDAKLKQRMMEKMINDVEQSRIIDEIEVAKGESELIKQYSDLLLQKLRIEEIGCNEMSDTDVEFRLLKRQQQRLAEEVEKIQSISSPNKYLQKLNIATSISAMDNLILRIEKELLQQMAETAGNKNVSEKKILKLEAETKELEMQVSLLLNTLAKLKAADTGKIPDTHRLHPRNLIPQVMPTRDFKRLKNLIQQSSNYPTASGSNEIELASFNYSISKKPSI